MPFDKTEYAREYYHKNKDKINQRRRKYTKEYNHKNKDKKKEYYQTEKGKKEKRINQWKNRNIIHHNFDELYEKYINTEHCELCSVKLTVDRYNTPTTRCLDHDHETGEFRNILCHSCNVKRG